MLKIAIKDLRLILHDKRAVVLTLFLPIALITLFAFAYGGIGGSNDANPITIYISDQDNTDITKDIILQLDTLKSLDIKKMPLDSAKTEVKKNKNTIEYIFIKIYQFMFTSSFVFKLNSSN